MFADANFEYPGQSPGRGEPRHRQVGQVQAGRHQRRRGRRVPGRRDPARRPRRLQVAAARCVPAPSATGSAACARRGRRSSCWAPLGDRHRRVAGRAHRLRRAVPPPPGGATSGRTSGARSSSSSCCNTLVLLAGVGAGTLVVGTGLAWLVVHYRFPGRAHVRVGADPPAGDARLRHRLRVPRPLRVLGTGADRSCARASARGSRAARSCARTGASTLMMTLVFYPYVYLLARTAFREQGAATLETARSLGLLARAAPSCASRCRWRGPSLAAGVAARDDGGPRRLRHRRRPSATARSPRRSTASGTACSTAWPPPSWRACCCCSPSGSSRSSAPRAGRARFTQAHRRGPGARAGVAARLARGRGDHAPAWPCSALAFLLPVGQLALWAVEALRAAACAAPCAALLANTARRSPAAAAALACLLAARARLRAAAPPLRPGPAVRPVRRRWATRCPAR